MRSVFRIVCMVIGVLAFVFALNEFLSLLFGTGGQFVRLLAFLATCVFAFITLVLMHNVETYPAREQELLLEERLEREARRQLGIH